MSTRTLLVASMLSITFGSYAAEEKPAAAPPSGSATTQQESPSHPAAGADKAAENKAKPTAETSKPKHPAVAESKDTSPTATPNAGAATARNWTQIDKDRDNSISPDEMQNFLESEWAKRKQSS